LNVERWNLGRLPAPRSRLPAMVTGQSAELVEDGGEDELADGAFVAKANLAFGGVDVDIHGGRVNFEKENCGRVAAFGDVGMVGLEDGVIKGAAVHRAAIDERDQAVTRGAALPRATEEPAKAQITGGIFNFWKFDHFLGESAAPDFSDAFTQVFTRGRTKNQAAILKQAEGDFGMRDGAEADQAGDVGGFGVVGFEKFAAGGDGIEKMGDFDAGARRAAAGALMSHFPAVDEDFRAGGGIAGAGNEREARHTGDTRQGLAAEAKGAHRVEVGGFDNFRGRVAFKGEERFIRREAGAVVLDADEALAAVAEFDLDAGGPGVEGILDELLDNRSGALDHFAGGDLVGDPVREDADAGHGGELRIKN